MVGKFDPIKIAKLERDNGKLSQDKMRKILQSKKLISFKRKGDSLYDGVLLFGKNKGKRLSELLSELRTSGYVLSYLLGSKDIPKEIKRKVMEVVDYQINFLSSKGIVVETERFMMDSEPVEKDVIVTSSAFLDDIPW